MLNLILLTLSFVLNSNIIIHNEMNSFSKILIENEIPYHHLSSRVKTFESALLKHSLEKYKRRDIYSLHDLVAFRFVFYSFDDLYKFYHHNKNQKAISYYKNYIENPKDNGYKAIHFHYKLDCKFTNIKEVECQLFYIDDYYDSIYGNSSFYKIYK
jgi:ppGpp synthetase/RelA/SpoT-type nucleotidyltranferase